MLFNVFFTCRSWLTIMWKSELASENIMSNIVLLVRLYIFILRRWRVWSRNTIRVRSHIYFFCGGDPLCALERRPENTDGMFVCLTCGSFPSLERPADISPFAWVTTGSLPSVQNYRHIVFSSPMRIYKYPLRLTYFSVYRNLHT